MKTETMVDGELCRGGDQVHQAEHAKRLHMQNREFEHSWHLKSPQLSVARVWELAWNYPGSSDSSITRKGLAVIAMQLSPSLLLVLAVEDKEGRAISALTTEVGPTHLRKQERNIAMGCLTNGCIIYCGTVI